MELPEVVSVRKFREFNNRQKEELYETLLDLAEAIDEIPKKSLRRTLDLSLAVLRHKGDQVITLRERLAAKTKADSSDESHDERLLKENERLKRLMDKLEEEKSDLRHKIKALTDDTLQLQQRLQEAAQNAEVSDKDSTDPLSELDKQEELLRNINTKNKHIKRLLKDIEALQNQNIEQSKSIITVERELQHTRTRHEQLMADLALADGERKALKETVNELNIEIARLEGNITYLEEEREKSEFELKEFIDKLEAKAQSWKAMLDRKDAELKRLRLRLEHNDVADGEPGEIDDGVTDQNDGLDSEAEHTKLMHAIEARDKLIEQLELKIKTMAEEMVATTKVMNALTAERALERDPQKPRSCCKSTEEALQAANARCTELSNMLERAEEDNTLKSKQAMEAIAALHAYERGEDGLVKALRRCSTLEQKVTSRDKQIHALIMELNSMHEIAHENAVLRKRLNIPDDVVITAKNLSAKERQKEKIIDRLTLKLRASDEMRLQLKLERADLRKQLLQLQQQQQQQQHQQPHSVETQHHTPQQQQQQSTDVQSSDTTVADAVVEGEVEMEMDVLSLPSEIGEVPDSAMAVTVTVGQQPRTGSGVTLLDCNICANCKQQFNLHFLEDGGQQQQTIAELRTKYQDVLQENETLRLGMLEILEKLREYDDASEHITIESEVLYRLLAVLQQRHSPAQSTPKRLQSELNSLKEREEALRDLLQQTLNSEQDNGDVDQSMETDELASIEEPRESVVDNQPLQHNSELVELPQPTFEGVDSSTRPTTPNRSVVLPVVVVAEDTAERVRDLEQQIAVLTIYQQHYEQLQARILHIQIDDDIDADRKGNGSDDSEKCNKRAYAELQQQLLTTQLALAKLQSTYAYMREDFDRCLTHDKHTAAQHIKETAALKQELLNAQLQERAAACESEQQRKTYTHSREEYEILVQSNAELRAQLAQHIQLALSPSDAPADAQVRFKDICADYGIIEENLQLDYITRDEYTAQREQLNTATAQREELSRKSVQLEQLLLIAQEQIQSQQRLLNEITDNHIDLRHLVADLQSGSDDKFLLAKMQRDLDAAKIQVITLSAEQSALQQKCQQKQNEMSAELQASAQLKQNCHKELQHKELKIKFLMKSMHLLREKYAKFTPLIFLTNFIYAYNKFVQKTKISANNESITTAMQTDLDAKIVSALQAQQQINADESQHLIKLIKAETHAQLMEENCTALQQKCAELQQEVLEQRLRHARDTEHWHTVDALFGERTSVVMAERMDVGINTDMVADTPPVPAERKISPARGGSGNRRQMVDKQTSPIASPAKKSTDAKPPTDTNTPKSECATQTENMPMQPTDMERVEKELESSRVTTKALTAHVHVQTSPKHQAHQSAQTLECLVDKELSQLDGNDSDRQTLEQQLERAQMRHSQMEQLLSKTQGDLKTALGKIDTLQKQLNDKEKDITPTTSSAEEAAPTEAGGIIEKTILSFHTLLTEKDKSITKYQDLLQSEREQHQSAASKLSTELENLRSTITNLNFNIKTKDMEIMELKTKLEAISVRRNSNEKLDLAVVLSASGESGGASDVDVGDNSLNELTDEKIEEMFQHDAVVDGESTIEKQDTEALKELPTLLKQIKELKDKASYHEQMLKQKDEELTLLKEKINLYRERESTLAANGNTEMEQLRLLMEDKDKHINDLMETLNNFHEDQQRYINDSSNDSADRISKLAADLTRTEATNKIYHTQVDALRRQLNSLTQREKQARELNQSLRNQLIKRPVVSIKTELNARVKQENLQKRIQHLELELDEARAQIQRQQIIIDTKRARSASEVGLWEKQKRWQQNAEKFKSKLEETECMLEKTRTLLQSARNTVTRLEKEKQVLELKLGRVIHGGAPMSNAKCCRTPSCPNLHRGTCGHKYTPSESPETYTGGSSECSSPAHSAPCSRTPAVHCHPNAELLEALKARLELQQRKIMAMEMEGKGANTLTNELEKLQEKLSAIEAQNIRLEARNLQLQLDNDLLRQGDEGDRLQKRIKHLEDYIIALKEEMAQADARRELCKCTGIKVHTLSGQSAEQTILTLRNIVEKLRAENKYLKDSKRPCEPRSTVDMPNDFNRLQKMYTDALDKIKSLQLELNVKSKCGNCSKSGKNALNSDELKYVQEQLMKKTQLLQKAKVLLTRAAAKEKVLKEQLALWKRKCFELQNVPVIDEISE